MQRFQNFKEAVAEAGKMTESWVFMDGETLFRKQTLLGEAGDAMEAGNPLGEHDEYIITKEGAIGMVHRFDFTAKWLLLPEKPLEQFVGEMVELENAAKADADMETKAPQAWSKPIVAFCTNCGAKLQAGMAFCTECGTKIMQ